MKYTILGFQQTKLIENNLTIEDAFILRVIKDMFSSATMEFKEFEGTNYMWVNYTYLLSQIPIVGSKRNLKRRIEIYGKELLILRVLKNVRNGVKGSFAYIAPTEKLDLLQDYDGMDKIALPLGQNSIRVMTESPNKDTSIKDTSIKDNKYTVDFETWYGSYPNKFNKEQTFSNWKKLITIETIENVIAATIEYKKYLKINKVGENYIVRSTNFIGQKQEYRGYLKEDITQIIKPKIEVVEVPYEY